jgi:Uncharacterized protein conserved in bacteria
MLSIQGVMRLKSGGMSRRRFLEVGSLGGLSMASLSVAELSLGRHAAAGEPNPTELSFGRAKRCLLLFLMGGPPQIDTFDPKPAAPAEIRGELAAIPTSVPGVAFGELFPKLAWQANRLCVVRSVTHNDRVHTSAGYTMLTGRAHPSANADGVGPRPNPTDFPHWGSLLALAQPRGEGVPVFAALPELIKDANVNEIPGQGAGFLGRQFDPFRISGDAKTGQFRPPDIVLPSDVTPARLAERKLLADRLDAAYRRADTPDAGNALDIYRAQALDLLSHPGVRRAFDLDREQPAQRDAYGPHLFGLGCLLARRLLQAGVRLVTVYWHYEGPDDSPVWDTHENNFPHLRNRLAPPTDRAVSALLDDLAAHGLLEETLVIVMGEFGRSPKINSKGGREHWPQVQSVLLAGAGIRAGSVYGSSDKVGGLPAELPVSPADLTATFLHLLGVPTAIDIRDPTGRPFLASEGRVVSGLLA